MDKEQENRKIHQQMQQVKEEAAAVNANRGMDMLMNSTMKDKLENDPRFQELMKKK